MFFIAPGQKKGVGGGGGGLHLEVQTLTFLFTIFKRKANLFIYLPLEMAPLSQTFSRNAPSFFSFRWVSILFCTPAREIAALLSASVLGMKKVPLSGLLVPYG